MSEVKTYQVDGKTYEQRPLVYLQFLQLIEVLDGVEMPEENDVRAICAALGDRLMSCIAVALVEKGREVDDKDIPALAKHFSRKMQPHVAFQVVADFFTCNPVPDMVNGLTGVMLMARPLQKGISGQKSRNRSSSSAEGTGQSETPSSEPAAPSSAASGCESVIGSESSAKPS